VDTVIAKASSIHKHDFLQFKSKVTQSKIPYVVTSHPDLTKIQDIVDKHLQTFKTNINLDRIFPEKPMISFRRPKSLKDILVTTKVKPRQNSPKGESGCQTCILMHIAQTFKSRCGVISAIKGRHTCKTSNVVSNSVSLFHRV